MGLKDKEVHGLPKLTDKMIIQNQQREIGVLKSEIDELEYEVIKYRTSSTWFKKLYYVLKNRGNTYVENTLSHKIEGYKLKIIELNRAIEKLQISRNQQNYERDYFRDELKKHITPEELKEIYNQLNK